MNSVFNTTIAGINAMKNIIDNTIDKLQNPHARRSNERIFIENDTNSNSYTNTALKVQEIYDNYNDFITEEKYDTNAKIQDEQTKIEQLLKLEDLLCEKSNIFSIMTNDVYNQIKKDIIIDKKNTVNYNIRDKLSDITFAIKDFDKKLSFLEKDIKKSIINNIKKVNELIDKIHDINIEIRYFPIARMHDTINKLIEKREDLVDKLNSLIGIKVVKNHDNYKISLNDGISLIDNHDKTHLLALTSESDDKYISIGYLDPDDKIVKKIENMIPSSILSSLLHFRKEELNNTRNKIGQLIINFCDSMNEYHKLGNDIFSNHGEKIFHFSNPESIPSSSNTSSTQTSAEWYSSREAKDTDYIIYFKDNIWTVRRLLDNTTIPCIIREKNDLKSMFFDGIQFFIKGKNADGDIYMIKPYSQTLESLKLSLNNENPFIFPLKDNINDKNKHHTLVINKFNEDLLLHRQDNLDQSYQKFSKSISYQYNLLEEKLPFKKNMIKILENKKLSISNEIDKDYNDLNYQQEYYLAHVKVIETAENIFNEIIDEYS